MLVLVLRAGAGSRPGGRGTCSLLRQRKVPKRKATLQSATPSGQTCVGAFAGCAVELATRWRAALGQPRRVRSRSMRAKAPMPPRKRPAAGAARRGWAAQQPNSPTAQQPHGPLLRSAPMGAGALRRAAPGRAQRWPEGMFGCGIPSGCAEERSGQRIRARDCLSEASSSETPLDASTAGCPQRSEGTQPVGSLFLGLLSFGEAKESESPAGAKSRPPPRTQACTQA